MLSGEHKEKPASVSSRIMAILKYVTTGDLFINEMVKCVLLPTLFLPYLELKETILTM